MSEEAESDDENTTSLAELVRARRPGALASALLRAPAFFPKPEVARVSYLPLPAPTRTRVLQALRGELSETQLQKSRFAMDDEVDLFAEVGVLDLRVAADTIQNVGDVQTALAGQASKALRAMETAAARLEESERRERQSDEDRKERLTKIQCYDDAAANPFSLQNASLIPLKHLPPIQHTVARRAPRRDDEDAVDEEYGIEMGGELLQSSITNSKQPKRRRKDELNVDVVMKHYKPKP